MPEASKNRLLVDLAYICFLMPGTCALIDTVGFGVLGNSNFATGLSLMVLIPLAIASLVAVPVGVILSIMVGRELTLIVLSILSVVVVVVVIGEYGNSTLRNSLLGVYGLLAFVLPACWFVVRRKRFQTRDVVKSPP